MSIAAKIKHINGTNRRWQSQKKKALPSAEAHDCLHSELDSQQRIGQQQLNARTNVNGDAGLYVISPERAKVWFGSVDIYRQL